MNATVVTAIIAGIVAIIGSIVTGVIAIIRVLAETKAVKDAVIENAKVSHDTGEKRDKKLDRIEVLVDGRYGEVLQELADVKDLLAKVTGKASDVLKAEVAQVKANEQIARVAAATTRVENEPGGSSS